MFDLCPDHDIYWRVTFVYRFFDHRACIFSPKCVVASSDPEIVIKRTGLLVILHNFIDALQNVTRSVSKFIDGLFG